MRASRFLFAAAALAALFAAGAASAQQYYDPPTRVARLSDMRGDISYSPAGDGEWYGAERNRPLVRGDALWSDQGARAEVQVGSTWIRMDEQTSLELTQLTDKMLQVEVAEGTINIRVRSLSPGQRVEVDTPNLAFVIDRPGRFRFDVDREGDNTAIEARRGSGTVYGVGGRFGVRTGDVVVFYGEDVRDYELYASPGQDSFDRYVSMRDQRITNSPSLRYLGGDVVGYSDLDEYGRWGSSNYGAIWYPSNVYAGWAPYQDGQWVWQEPWGWTWVDDQPWGFAPSHYGRWAYVDGRWGWVPGQRTYRSVYAPALVAFTDAGAGAIGWFPLGPSDVYYPTYNTSSSYFRAVNVANTRVSPTTVNNVYGTYAHANSVPLAQGNYRNRTVPTAVTVVPQDVFVNARPVREARREQRELAANPSRGAELRRNPGLRPGRASVVGAARQARARPPQAVEQEQVIVHNEPPAARTAPSATTTPAPVAPTRERPHNFRRVTEQQAMTDARARGPRHQGESAAAATSPATPAAPAPATAAAPGGGRLRALDRSALPRMRGERRFQERQQADETAANAPSTKPAATPVPPAAQANVEQARARQAQLEQEHAAQQKEREDQRAKAEAARAAQQKAREEQRAQAEQARAAQQKTREQQKSLDEQAQQSEQARVAQQKAREEQRQATEAQRKLQQQQRESEQALRQAQAQRAQAQAENNARQQREAAAAEAKAVQERQQARQAQQEAQRQQREAQQAQHEAAKQQAEAATPQPKPTTPTPQAKSETAPVAKAATTPEAGAHGGPRRECLPKERIDAMRQRGVPEAELAEIKVCPVEPTKQ